MLIVQRSDRCAVAPSPPTLVVVYVYETTDDCSIVLYVCGSRAEKRLQNECTVLVLYSSNAQSVYIQNSSVQIDLTGSEIRRLSIEVSGRHIVSLSIKPTEILYIGAIIALPSVTTAEHCSALLSSGSARACCWSDLIRSERSIWTGAKCPPAHLDLQLPPLLSHARATLFSAQRCVFPSFPNFAIFSATATV